MPTPQHVLRFSVIPGSFAVCQLPPGTPIPDWLPASGLLSITRADDEISIVCDSSAVPGPVKADRGWISLKLEGPFPFSMTGVLASFIQPLAERAVPIFAISTYNTDHVLIPEQHAAVGLQVLREAGHELISNEVPGKGT
jgi:hypothetical protein